MQEFSAPAREELSASARLTGLAVAAIAFFALGLQLQILIGNHQARGESAIWALWFFFGFFTIWTNLLVAITALAAAIDRGGRRFLARHPAQTAVAVYIAIVMIIYEVMLRKLWRPEGAQWWADMLLHNAVPVLFVAWWLIFSSKGGLGFADAFKWLVYPLCYLAYALVRGAVSGFYAYPFIDVSKNGYGGVAVSSALVCAGFVAVGFAFVAIDRMIARTVKP